jgi:SAM-dependent methyltransferase
VRLRGLATLLSTEIFGVPLALPDMPKMKALRGFGMSDPPTLAARLADTFDYTNTFYHQAPKVDIVRPDDTEWGRYDFIVSSEVMEHVPPPVEHAFRNLYKLLKPNGVLLLTVPYGVGMPPQEHFPDLYEFALASPGGKTVLVNRRRDGATEVFENLCFHGGDGSTLELRVFTEDLLIATLKAAGFDDVRIASESVVEFGVEHAESWSLPIVARKGRMETPVADVARAYATSAMRVRELTRELESVQAEYQRFITFHNEAHAAGELKSGEQAEWVRKTEALAAERTEWALRLDKDYKDVAAQLERQRAETQLAEDRAAALAQRGWVKLGRKLGVL